MRDATQGRDQDEHRPVLGCRHAPDERHDEAEHGSAHQKLPQERGLGRIDLPDHPGQDLIKRVEQDSGEGDQCRGLGDAEARAEG